MYGIKQSICATSCTLYNMHACMHAYIIIIITPAPIASSRLVSFPFRCHSGSHLLHICTVAIHKNKLLEQTYNFERYSKVPKASIEMMVRIMNKMKYHAHHTLITTYIMPHCIMCLCIFVQGLLVLSVDRVRKNIWTFLPKKQSKIKME